MTDLVVGVDSSTQATKIEVRNAETGAVVARASAPHPAVTPPACEQDPEAWWTALASCLAQVREHLGYVRAISVAGQQHGMVVVGAGGHVIRPAKLWNDTTSAPQAARLVAGLGASAWAMATGSVPVASFTITKLAWLAEHEPAAMSLVDKVMLPHDYLTWRLTGEHVTDRGDASGTGWWDPERGAYRPDLLGLVTDDPEAWLARLPRVLGPLEIAGTVRSDIAAALGLRDGVLVGPGTGDNMGAAIGLMLGPGDVAVSLGTSGTVYAVSEQGAHDATGAVAGFADATGRFLPLVCTINATGVTDAAARWLGLGRDEFAALALSEPADPEVVLVPYLDGERTPNLPDASGRLVGLRSRTSRAQLAASAHLGVLCGLLEGVDCLAAAGSPLSGRLVLVGGGAKSAAYRQLLADAWGAPIDVATTDEAVSAGAAVQAAAVLGDRSLAGVATAWGIGDAARVPPRANADGTSIRAAYRRAASLVADQG